MTLQEQARLLGRAFWFTSGGDSLAFEVEVRDVRVSFGRVDVLIRPVAGAGARWVSRDSVEYVEGGE